MLLFHKIADLKKVCHVNFTLHLLEYGGKIPLFINANLINVYSHKQARIWQKMNQMGGLSNGASNGADHTLFFIPFGAV